MMHAKMGASKMGTVKTAGDQSDGYLLPNSAERCCDAKGRTKVMKAGGGMAKMMAGGGVGKAKMMSSGGKAMPMMGLDGRPTA
jgi:hypothetical protein